MDEMMMNMMFGGGGGGGRQQRRRKGKDVGHAFPVSLEDLYKGKTARLPREKTVLCTKCRGSGSNKPGASSVCQTCRGQGARMAMRQIGPGMVQQMQVPCDACSGRGTSIGEKDKCQTCRGKRTATIDSPLTVQIEKGMSHQQQIPFAEEGDQDPDVPTPGDVVIVLQQLKHDRFKRDDDDLHMTKKITLAESLCGFQFSLTHLDNRVLSVEHPAGSPIKPEDKMCLKGHGMPVYGKPGQFGDLVIEFEVEFPSRLEESAVDTLRTALPAPAAPAVAHEDAEEHFMSSAPLDEMRKELEKENDDDDDDGQQGGVRCAHQ